MEPPKKGEWGLICPHFLSLIANRKDEKIPGGFKIEGGTSAAVIITRNVPKGMMVEVNMTYHPVSWICICFECDLGGCCDISKLHSCRAESDWDGIEVEMGKRGEA